MALSKHTFVGVKKNSHSKIRNICFGVVELTSQIPACSAPLKVQIRPKGTKADTKISWATQSDQATDLELTSKLF